MGDYKRLRSKYLYAAQLAGTAVSIRPFEVTFRFITSFEGAPPINGGQPKRPLVLLGEGDALSELHKIFGTAMEKSGFNAMEDFTPHMTLAYGPESIPLQAVEPVRFAVNDFVLIHSKLWLGEYNIIGRWSLHG